MPALNGKLSVVMKRPGEGGGGPIYRLGLPEGSNSKMTPSQLKERLHCFLFQALFPNLTTRFGGGGADKVMECGSFTLLVLLRVCANFFHKQKKEGGGCCQVGKKTTQNITVSPIARHKRKPYTEEGAY